MIGRPNCPERGASLVEFALLAPLIFALLLGMLTGGLSLSRKNSMTNAVREGARLGATLQESDTWADAVRSRVVEVSGGDLQPSEVCVKLVTKTSSGESMRKESPGCPLPSALEPALTNIPVGQCAVKVWAQRSSDLNVIFFTRPLTLTAVSVNRYERSGVTPWCAS